MSRVALLTAGKALPTTVEEKILVYAYHSALDGFSLIKTYLRCPHGDNLSGDNLSAFILGFSSGSAVYRFHDDAGKNGMKRSLN